VRTGSTRGDSSTDVSRSRPTQTQWSGVRRGRKLRGPGEGRYTAPSRRGLVNASHGQRVFRSSIHPRRRGPARRRRQPPAGWRAGPEWCGWRSVGPTAGPRARETLFSPRACDFSSGWGLMVSSCLRERMPALSHRQQRAREQSTRNALGAATRAGDGNGRWTTQRGGGAARNARPISPRLQHVPFQLHQTATTDASTMERRDKIVRHQRDQHATWACPRWDGTD